jgi:hypothetical protein
VVLNGQEAQNSPISSYMGIITKKKCMGNGRRCTKFSDNIEK